MNNKKPGIFAGAAKALSQIEPNELKATIASGLFVFILMASYYVLRPVRDAMASDWSDLSVSMLWVLNFFVSVLIISIYGFAITRIKLKNIVPAMYGFFALSFIGFYFAAGHIEDRYLVDKGFYFWISVFALFHVSVFWTLMADTFNPEQAKRLFGVIAAGSSAGVLVGPWLSVILADRIDVYTLLLVVAFALLIVIPLVFYLYRLKSSELGNETLVADTTDAQLGGKWWQGFKIFASNPYLLGLGAFILLYVCIGSFVYFEQKHLLEDFTRAERQQILGGIDGITNLLTFGLAFFATSRIVRNLGMPTALAVVPVLMMVALVILAFAPILTVLLALQVVRRGGNYGLTRPAREMLYTRGITHDERVRAKPVIDVAVYRGGDAVSALLFAFLTEVVGLSIAVMAAIGAVVAGIWAWVGIKLGRAFDQMEDPQE